MPSQSFQPTPRSSPVRALRRRSRPIVAALLPNALTTRAAAYGQYIGHRILFFAGGDLILHGRSRFLREDKVTGIPVHSSLAQGDALG
jgi:hypothetical protein